MRCAAEVNSNLMTKVVIILLKNQNVRNYKLYQRLLRELNQSWHLLFISILGSILYSLCDAYAMYLIKPLLNKGFTPNGGEFLRRITLLFLLIFILRGLGSFLSSYFMGALGAKIVYSFRKRIFSRFLDLPAQYYDCTSPGKLLSKIIYKQNDNN